MEFTGFIQLPTDKCTYKYTYNYTCCYIYIVSTRQYSLEHRVYTAIDLSKFMCKVNSECHLK